MRGQKPRLLDGFLGGDVPMPGIQPMTTAEAEEAAVFARKLEAEVAQIVGGFEAFERTRVVVVGVVKDAPGHNFRGATGRIIFRRLREKFPASIWEAGGAGCFTRFFGRSKNMSSWSLMDFPHASSPARAAAARQKRGAAAVAARVQNAVRGGTAGGISAGVERAEVGNHFFSRGCSRFLLRASEDRP